MWTCSKYIWNLEYWAYLNEKTLPVSQLDKKHLATHTSSQFGHPKSLITQPWSGQQGARCGQLGARSRKPGAKCGSQEPWVGSQEPGVGSQKPGVGSQKPGVGSQKPGVGSQKPGVGSQKPGVGSQEWAARSQEWAARSQEWAARSQEWAARSGKPEARSGKPEARSGQPEVRSQKPGVDSQKPGVGSQKPGVGSQEPCGSGCVLCWSVTACASSTPPIVPGLVTIDMMHGWWSITPAYPILLWTLLPPLVTATPYWTVWCLLGSWCFVLSLGDIKTGACARDLITEPVFKLFSLRQTPLGL